MKIVNNKSNNKKSYCKTSHYEKASYEKESINTHRDSIPFTSITTHHNKKQTCPNIHILNQYRYSPIMQNYSTVGRISMEGMFNPKETFNKKIEGKILNLQEIKGKKAQIVIQQKTQEKRTKSKKIFVSISKQNRASLSKPKRVTAQPKLCQVGGQMELLRSLSVNRRMVDIIELQMQQNIRSNRFFCNQ